jgi:glutathione S-transferase
MMLSMSGQRPVLITISISHYCEKARWALDRAGIAYDERRYLPALHQAQARRHGSVTVPVLVCKEAGTLRESSDIVAYADARGGRIDCENAEARALADDYDERLGPATRLWVYHSLLDRTDLTTPSMTAGVSAWQKAVWRVGVKPIGFAVTKVLKIDDASAVEAEKTFRAIYADADARLADGRPYLAGDTFSIADLTFAALSAPLIGPSEYGAPLPVVEDLPPHMADIVREHRASRAGQHAQKMFATERGPVATTATPAPA